MAANVHRDDRTAIFLYASRSERAGKTSHFDVQIFEFGKGNSIEQFWNVLDL